jgi:hypothetical protein
VLMGPLRSSVFILESVFSLAALEAKLVAYVKDPAAATQPFDVSTVPKISRAQAAQEAARKSRVDDFCIVPDIVNQARAHSIRLVSRLPKRHKRPLLHRRLQNNNPLMHNNSRKFQILRHMDLFSTAA